MPAFIADERRERVAVQSDQPAAGKPWGPAGDVEKIVENRHPFARHPERQKISRMTDHSAAAFAPRLASIWPIASTTASKVRSVEA